MKIYFSEFMNFVVKANHFNPSTALKSYKIIYYKSGSGQAMIGYSVYKFKEGMFAVVAPNEIFQDIVTSQTEEMICELIIDSDIGKIHNGLYYDNNNIIQKQFEKIRHEYQNSELCREELLNLLSAELYYLIFRSINKPVGKANTIQDIISYIDENYFEDIKIENLARKAGYTCRHFRNLFTEKTGVPPSEYLLKKRIESSKNLLITTLQSIVEISQACGFSSASQFAMLFRRYTGMTPTEYRTMLMQTQSNIK